MVKLQDGETLAQAQKRDLLERVEKLGGVSDALRNCAVRIREARTQHEAFEMAERIAKVPHVPVWHVKFDNLPDAAKELMRKNESVLSNCRVTIAYPPIGGQTGGGGENVSLIVLPWWSHENARAIEIEVGCNHKMKTTNLGRCYNKYSCVKCGFEYSVDSGD